MYVNKLPDLWLRVFGNLVGCQLDCSLWTMPLHEITVDLSQPCRPAIQTTMNLHLDCSTVYPDACTGTFNRATAETGPNADLHIQSCRLLQLSHCLLSESLCIMSLLHPCSWVVLVVSPLGRRALLLSVLAWTR